MQWFVYVLLHVHHFLFSNLFSGIVGSGELRPADMFRSEDSGTHFAEGYVNTGLWDVT
jgi:hypothetical protein